MNFWNQLPLLRILIPFIAGIIAALAIGIDFRVSYEVIIFLAISISIFIFWYSKIIKNYSHRWIFGFLLNIMVFVLGFELTCSKSAANQLSDFSHYRATTDTVVATIANPVNERENTCSVLLNINSIKLNNKWIAVSGKAMTYFEKDSLTKSLKYGDQLIISSNFSDVNPPQNPGEFNYKNYLAMRSIYSEGYVKARNWKVLSHDNGNLFRAFAFKIREKFLKIFEANNISGDEYAVAGAMLLGYTDKIDADLFNVYQGTGVLHVLCVSGLHVGILFLVLNFLLVFLDRFKKGKYIKAVILILFIWLYAAITGFSPAVSRVTTTLSFLIIGKVIGRYTNVFNSLAASALLLLLIDPLLLTNNGFQFSYFAVCGIIIIQRKIYKLWFPSNWLLKHIWTIVTVSIAAQLATFPLGLLYFHQFPNYFLLANIIVLPLSYLIIFCGILVLLTSPVHFISGLFSKLLVLLIHILNSSIRFVEGLPMAVTREIYITSLEAILIYGGVISIIYFLISKRKLYFKLALLTSIFFMSSVTVRSFNTSTQKIIICYDIKKSSVIDFISGRNHIILCDSSFMNNSKDFNARYRNCWIELSLREPEYMTNKLIHNVSFPYDTSPLLVKRNFIQFYNKRIAIINSDNYNASSVHPISVDLLVLSGNIKTGIADLLYSYKPRLIIIDASNSLWKSKKWIDECAQLKIPCYSVLKSGAYEISI